MFVFPVFDFLVHVVEESLCLRLIVLYVFLYRVFPLLDLQPKQEMCKRNIKTNMAISKFVLAITTKILQLMKQCCYVTTTSSVKMHNI